MYGNIYKAVFITKESKLKRKQAIIKGKQATYKQLSTKYGVSVIEIEQMQKNGIPFETLEKRIKKGVKKEEQISFNEESLYKYCLEHSYNYWVINYLIKDYGKAPEEAVKIYVENGQQIPTKWIYEKYDLLFKHLTLKYGLDSNRIIKIMKDNECGIEEAITKLIFVSNNDNNDFKKAEIDWMQELYLFIKNIPKDEYLKIKNEFFITNREENFIKEKSNQIDLINRQLLLFEFAEVIDSWTTDELLEMMQLYEITEEEKQEIILYLYSPFREKIIDPTNEYKILVDTITQTVLDNSITIEDILNNTNLSETSKTEIIKKRKSLEKLQQDKKSTLHI